MDQRREPARRTFASRRGLEGEIVDRTDVGGMGDASNMHSTGDEKMAQAPMSLLKRAVEVLLDAPGREAIMVCGELHEALLKSASTASWVPNEQAWADGFEAGATWPQHTASGVPVDPPLNPYETDGQS